MNPQEINQTGREKIIVRTDEKQRYSFNEDKTLIRANQGHSVPVDVELEAVTPPELLYHGTGEKYVASIEAQGLIPKTHLYVHLSGDYETAFKVGARHGKPRVYQVASGQMAADHAACAAHRTLTVETVRLLEALRKDADLVFPEP